MAPFLIHLLCIAAFLALPYFFTPPHPPEMGNSFEDYLILKKMSTNALLVALFYLNSYVLIPRYFFAKRYVLFIALLIPPSLATTFFIEFFKTPTFVLKHIPLLMRVETNFFLVIATLCISFALSINRRLQESEKQKLNAELSLLKAQINPHFLFNTLNSIYTLAIKKSDLTASAIVKLSGLMRYVITEAQTEYVSLEKEMNYANNYIELQKIRLGNTAKIEIIQTIPPNTLTIAPLLLIPFIENAFKYGVNPETDSPIHISLVLQGSTLVLTTRNRIFHLPQPSNEASCETSSGLGIQNVRKRLALMYPDKHTLHIDKKNQEYIIHFTIEL